MEGLAAAAKWLERPPLRLPLEVPRQRLLAARLLHLVGRIVREQLLSPRCPALQCRFRARARQRLRRPLQLHCNLQRQRGRLRQQRRPQLRRVPPRRPL